MPARRMSAKEARANFGDLLGSVYYTGEPVIIERKGRRFAVVISPKQYDILEKQSEKAWATVDRIRERNADKDPDEVLRDVTAEVEAVRQEMYEQEQRAGKRRR
jgi:prevent-host-death family protein